MCGSSQRASSPTSNATHDTQFCKAYTTGFSASQHLSTKSHSRTPSEVAIRCSFKMLIFRIPRSTPEMNVQCSPAFSASCSCVNPSAPRRIRIVCPSGFLGSVTNTYTSPMFSVLVLSVQSSIYQTRKATVKLGDYPGALGIPRIFNWQAKSSFQIRLGPDSQVSVVSSPIRKC